MLIKWFGGHVTGEQAAPRAGLSGATALPLQWAQAASASPSAAGPGAGMSHRTAEPAAALLAALSDGGLAAPDSTHHRLWNRVWGRLVRPDRLTSCVCAVTTGETGKTSLRCLPLQGGVEFIPWFIPWGCPQRGKGFRYWFCHTKI